MHCSTYASIPRSILYMRQWRRYVLWPLNQPGFSEHFILCFQTRKFGHFSAQELLRAGGPRRTRPVAREKKWKKRPLTHPNQTVLPNVNLQFPTIYMFPKNCPSYNFPPDHLIEFGHHPAVAANFNNSTRWFPNVPWWKQNHICAMVEGSNMEQPTSANQPGSWTCANEKGLTSDMVDPLQGLPRDFRVYHAFWQLRVWSRIEVLIVTHWHQQAPRKLSKTSRH